MKIIYLHQYFNTPEMIGSTRSYEIAKGLIKMGHEVTIITSYREKFKNNKWFETEVEGIKVHWIPIEYSNRANFLKRLNAFLLFAFKSYFKSIKLNADLIFASSTPLTIAIPAYFISKKKDIPMIFEVRDLWPDIPIAMKILKNPFLILIAKWIEKKAYKHSSAIVALSPQMKKEIILKNVETKKVAIIPNSSDLNKFKFNKNLSLNFRNKRLWLKNKPLLIYTGSFGKVNDLSYAVELARELNDQKSNTRILLIGDGYEKEKLIYQAKNFNVYNKNLFFENPIPKNQVPACYSAADLSANFVINIEKNWSNSANKFFDSLAAAKPIYLNHGGWMHNLVKKYECGLCMNGKTIKFAAKELDSKINNRKWLRLSGIAARILAEKLFDRQIHILQLEEILHLAINNKSNLTSQVTKDFFKI